MDRNVMVIKFYHELRIIQAPFELKFLFNLQDGSRDATQESTAL